MVDDEAVTNQYGHDKPQIHQIQHIDHVETLQQFSPGYPIQPIYFSHFKENDVGALRTAANTTEASIGKDNKNKETTNAVKTTNIDEKIVNSNNNTPLTISEKSTQIPITENTKQIASSELAKSQVTEASKLPTPMDRILAVNTVHATARLI